MSRLKRKRKSVQPVQRPSGRREQGGYKGLKEGGSPEGREHREGENLRGSWLGMWVGPEYLGP